MSINSKYLIGNMEKYFLKIKTMSKKRILNPTIVREKLEDESGLIFG